METKDKISKSFCEGYEAQYKPDIIVVAEFMGVEHKPDPFVKSKDLYWHYNELHLMSKVLLFDTSWDWLMPSCKKFDELYIGKEAPIGYIDHCEKIDNAVSCYEIEWAFEALVEGIKWYNTQPK